MLVIINGINNGIVWNNFSFTADQPESALDKVSAYVALGLTLFRVLFIVDSSQREIPVDVFDGHSFDLPFQQLRHQWEKQLDEHPVSPSILRRARNQAWNHQLVAHYEKQIRLLSQALESLGRAATQNAARQPSSTQIRISNQYASLLQRQQRQLVALRISHQTALDRGQR